MRSHMFNIGVIEQTRVELGNAVVPFGMCKDTALKDLPHKELCLLADLAVQGDRDEYIITMHQPLVRGLKSQQFAFWTVRFHYPLVLMARRYLYELRDVKFRLMVEELKAAEHTGCAKCGQGEIEVETWHYDDAFHNACWRDMLEAERTAARMS